MKYLYKIKLETAKSFTEVAKFTSSNLSTVVKKIYELAKKYDVNTKPISSGIDEYGYLNFTNAIYMEENITDTCILGKRDKKLWIFITVL